MIASGRSRCIQSRTACCCLRSSASRPTVRTWQCSRASLRTTAEPTRPRCPATQMRRPSISNSRSVIAIEALHPLHEAQIGLDHFGDEVGEADLVAPPQPRARLRRIALEMRHFGQAKVLRIDPHPRRAGLLFDAHLLDAAAAPTDRAADLREGLLDEFPDAVA